MVSDQNTRDQEFLEKEIERYTYNLQRFKDIVSMHRDELVRINTKLEFLRSQRNSYREKVKKLQDLRLKRGEKELTPVEEKIRGDLVILNQNLDQLDFQFEEQSEFLDLAKQELQVESSEITPKIEELKQELNALKK